MKIRTVLPAALVVAVLAGTAACSSGDQVTTKPKSPTAKTTAASSEAAPAESPAPKAAKVGDTITLKGMDAGSKVDVTVVKVDDPAEGADEFTAPGAGKRFVGVQFQLVNSGKGTYSDSPGNGAQISDEQGQQFTTTYAEIKAGPAMASDLRLLPGAKGLGWLVFEVPKTSKVATVQFTMDSGFSDQTGQWSIG